MKKIVYLVTSLLIASPLATTAHSDEYLDSHPSMSLNGGQTHMAGPYHIEIVTTPEEITVFMTDHGGNPIDVEIAHGSAIIMNADDTKTTIELKPAGENFLKGSGEYTITETTNVWVSVKFPDEPAWRSKFTPLAKRKVADDDPSVSGKSKMPEMKCGASMNMKDDVPGVSGKPIEADANDHSKHAH